MDMLACTGARAGTVCGDWAPERRISADRADTMIRAALDWESMAESACEILPPPISTAMAFQLTPARPISTLAV
jgi:hypothetical protein